MPTGDGAPTEALVAGAVGDRCVNCGAPLSSDQRYCVNCGERRGQPRFTLAQQQKSAPADTAPLAPPPGLLRKSRILGGATPRMSGGATLVAGVGTLLLAMGVGVLIGHNSAGTNNSKAAAAPQVIRLQDGGSSSSGASTTAGTGGSAGSSSSGSSTSGGGSHAKHKSSGGSKHKSGSGSHKKSASASVAKAPPPVVVHKAAQAASKVLGGSNTPPPTVTQGQKGSGPGFNKKTHKFDGSFFGG